MRVPTKLVSVLSIAALVAVPSAAGAETGDRDKTSASEGNELVELAPRGGATEAPAGLADAVRDLQAGRDIELPETSREMTASGVTAATAPTTTPVFTSPAEGATVTGHATVSVTSSAPQVRIAMPAVGFSGTVPVVDGVATTQVPTWGAEFSQTLTAVDCDEVGACGTTQATRTVTVSNPAPFISSPADSTAVSTSFVSTATAGGGAVQWRLDGVVVGFDNIAPYQQTLYTDGLDEGVHALAAFSCNEAGTACATGTPSAAVTISVKRTLSPVLKSILPTPFSPGNDGRRDNATVTYGLETTQAVRWRVTNGAGTTVVGARSLGTKASGTHRFTFNGKRSDGSYLPSGRYTVHLDTTKTVSGEVIRGHAMGTVTIDRVLPRVSSVSAAPATFFPVKDGHKDTTVLRGQIGERVASAKVEIFTAGGAIVRALYLGQRPAGSVAATWNGRRPNGKLVPEGTYRFRWVTQDAAGNRFVGAKSSVTVSHKKLVKLAGSKTVTAEGSLVDYFIGYCSVLAAPGFRGWAKSLGYYSDFDLCSVYEDDDLVFGIHGVTLPRAVKYGTVRVNTYGGQAIAGTGDFGVLLYLDGAGEVTEQGRVLDPAVGTYAGPVVGPRFVSSGRRVRWVAAADDFNWYDIKTFTVRYTYSVLR